MCVRLHSESSEPTMFSQATPDEHPPTPPPCRWPALLTLPTLAKFQLVWRRLWDPVLFPSSRLVEHTVTTVCVLPEYQPIKKRRNAMCIRIFSDPSKCPFFLRPDLYRFEAKQQRLVFSPLFLSPSPPDATAKPMASSHHFTPPRQV